MCEQSIAVREVSIDERHGTVGLSRNFLHSKADDATLLDFVARA
jgi:hypothetical protein